MMQNAPDRWEDLLRRAAERALAVADDALPEIDRAVEGKMGEHDLLARSQSRRANRLNLLQWITSILENPSAVVRPRITEDMRAQVRNLARRGRGEAALASYRAGQQVAWRHWINIAFDVTGDADEARMFLARSSQLIVGYMDAVIDELAKEMHLARSERSDGWSDGKLEIVRALLAGQTVARRTAEHELGYPLGGSHQAMIIWADEGSATTTVVDQTVKAIEKTASRSSILAIASSRDCIWLWTAADASEISVSSLPPSARIAIGGASMGVNGFVRSHRDAEVVRRLMVAGAVPSNATRYEDVRLLTILSDNRDAADRFINDVLGSFLQAKPRLQEILLAYHRNGLNAANTAIEFRLHRNTLMRALARAKELLPNANPTNSVEVGLALEILASRPTGSWRRKSVELSENV
jgi:DNA-binding PucR family transcriptional regulator